MADNQAKYGLWLEKTAADPELNAELRAIEGKEDEIADRFYRSLEFGTAGLRGVLGAGTNRMNIYTVGQATQGLADFLNAGYKCPAVAVACDSRINSELLAREAACVLAANGVKTYIFSDIMPTPVLSFAVRRLGCRSGIVITASHNPAEYNGYKCYDPEGYQMTDEAALKTYEYIQKTDVFEGVRKIAFDEGVKRGLIEYTAPSLLEEYYEKVAAQCVNPGVCAGSGLTVVYTPLNGTGNKPVREMLRRIGLEGVGVVPEQEMPDGNFPTCPKPNPEIRQAFELALKMAESNAADLLLATDPDCDRVGIAVRENGGYKLLSGNEVGALLADYLLSSRAANGTLPEKPVIVKSFVTTNLVNAVAQSYGCEVVSLLTGFKYIGEFITGLEKRGEENRFVFGLEESYGYLAGTHARDKDAVVASMLICEMAAFYKTKNKTLAQILDEIYQRHGIYLNTVLNFGFEGASGMAKMKELMDGLRQNPPSSVAGMPVESILDYQKSEALDIASGSTAPINLPKSNVLDYRLPGGNSAIVRPSGTEPKIKVYVTAVASVRSAAEELAARIGAQMKQILGIEE